MNWNAKPLTKREIEVSSWASPGQGGATSGHRHLCALREPLGVQEPEDPLLIIFPLQGSSPLPRRSSQASREISLQQGVQGGTSLCASWLGLELVKQVL